MNKFKSIAADHRGSVYTDTFITFAIFTVFLVIGITSFAAMSSKFTLTQSANSVKRIIETDGRYDTSEQQKISELLAANNINAKITVTPSKSVYKLGERFSVTLSSTASIGGIGKKLTVPVSGKAFGSCEVYSK